MRRGLRADVHSGHAVIHLAEPTQPDPLLLLPPSGTPFHADPGPPGQQAHLSPGAVVCLRQRIEGPQRMQYPTRQSGQFQPDIELGLVIRLPDEEPIPLQYDVRLGSREAAGYRPINCFRPQSFDPPGSVHWVL